MNVKVKRSSVFEIPRLSAASKQNITTGYHLLVLEKHPLCETYYTILNRWKNMYCDIDGPRFTVEQVSLNSIKYIENDENVELIIFRVRNSVH